MKLQFKIAFLSYFFFCYQETIKKQTGSAWSFLQLRILACRGISIPHLKLNFPFFCYPFFFEQYLNPQVRINQMVKIVLTEHISERQGMCVIWIDRIYYSLFRTWNPTFWSVKKQKKEEKKKFQNRHCAWAPHAIGV